MRRVLWLLLACSFTIAGERVANPDADDAIRMSAVTGGEAALPCDAGGTSAGPGVTGGDGAQLIVWYKDDHPIYSFDGRAGGVHWADSILGGRVAWAGGRLRLRAVETTDRALYRCRVDYRSEPTRNYKVYLEVIELPEQPKIFDQNDKEVIGFAGPYIEDTSLRLTCVVNGGSPPPRLRWWRDDRVLATLPPPTATPARLELRESRLTREHLHASYSCTADNTAIVPPLRTNVQIQLHLRPLLVEILSGEQPLSVGRTAELRCRSVGARPAATLSWWLNGGQLTPDDTQQSSDNETISILRWTPQLQQDGRQLICRAAHHTLPSPLQAAVTLNLHYAPIVTLQLGSKLNPNDIEEGDDVYFECSVRANPPAYKVVWEHNGALVVHNQRGGVIAGGAHLALRGVSRTQAGRYSCTASNVEGDGTSKDVNLQVVYKPVCKVSTTTVVGAALNETSVAVCEVDAFPAPNTFHWTFNNSATTVEVDASKFSVEANGRSVLKWIPTSHTEFGSLYCRAANLAGQQMEPCVVTILPAATPQSLYNCSTYNLTDDSVELRCMPGYDGGLNTSYTCEVWDGGTLVANVTQLSPQWTLRSIGAGKLLTLRIYGHNARGRSAHVSLRLRTLSTLALHTEANSPDSGESNWTLAVVVTAAVSLVAVVAALVARRRRSRLHTQCRAPTTQTGKKHKNSINSPMQPDDKNPDVIPLTKSISMGNETRRPPQPPPYCSQHSLHFDTTAKSPASDVQSIATPADDRRSAGGGTLSRRREVVTTRTPLLPAGDRESCV